MGTKLLIEDYIDEVTKQLNFICDVNVPELNLKEKLQFFTDTQKSFGRTALLLSGGGAFGKQVSYSLLAWLVLIIF